jgi:hypothetical protein
MLVNCGVKLKAGDASNVVRVPRVAYCRVTEITVHQSYTSNTKQIADFQRQVLTLLPVRHGSHTFLFHHTWCKHQDCRHQRGSLENGIYEVCKDEGVKGDDSLLGPIR